MNYPCDTLLKIAILRERLKLKIKPSRKTLLTGFIKLSGSRNRKYV